MNANGNVWHKKQRDKGELPKCGNIDREAHWGKSGCGQWVYGYRIHCLTLCGPAGIIWPADIAIVAANIKDAEVFDEHLSKQLPKQLQVLLGDGGYDQDSCYQLCDAQEISLIVPIKVKKTQLQNVENVRSFIMTLTHVKSLLYVKPPLNLFKASLNPWV